MNTANTLNKLIEHKNLTEKEAGLFLEEIMKGNVPQIQTAAALTALRMKGETIDEIAGFVKTMRKHMTRIRIKNAIDVCGTGGDRANAFNISTAVAFVIAGAGVHVAKHGNRATSSKCGSADVLEALGINITLQPGNAEELLKKTGFTFLFAPIYHPAMKSVGLVRKELKTRTVFNFLGPFTNPAGSLRQLLGVPNIAIAKKLSKLAIKLNYEHLMIVSSEDNMDEISVSAPTHIYEIKNESIKHKIINPEMFGIKRAARKALLGGDAITNAKILKDILAGKKGPKRDIVLINSGAALYVSGRVKTLKEGMKLAEESIDTGKGKEVLRHVIDKSQN